MFSSIAAVEYYGSAHTFCAYGGGCDAVRASGLGRSIGRALPAIGLLGNASVLAGALSRRASLQLAALAAAATGGAAGIALLALQALAVGAFCSICVAADVAAVLAGALSLPLLRARGALAVPGVRVRGFWLAAAVVAAGAPPALSLSRPQVRPPYVAALAQRGRINVVEFSDFECPFCRAMHPVLARALAPYGERVHFERKVFPLPSHAHSQAAARAYMCAEAQGRGEALADRLFAADDVSESASERHAAAAGVELESFRRCTRDPATQRELLAQIGAIRASGMRGLPTVWIGDRVIEGFDRRAGSAPYAAALAAAARGDGTTARIGPWLALAVLIALALLSSARARGSR